MSIEVYIKGPRVEPEFWTYSGQVGRWIYNGPYSRKRDLSVHASTLHLSTPDGDRISPIGAEQLDVSITADSLIFALPDDTNADALLGVWFVLGPPRDPRVKNSRKVA